MVVRRKRIVEMFALAAVAGALASFPTLAAWVHPSVPGGSNMGSPQVVVGAGASKALSASASNPYFNASATATATSIGAATTTTSTKPGGSTTAQTVTSFGPATGIVVTVTVTVLGGPATSYTFNFANLNAAPQSVTLGNGYGSMTVAPNSAGNNVGITYGNYVAPTANTMTLNLAPPATTMTGAATGNSATPQSIPTPTAVATPGSTLLDPPTEVRMLSRGVQQAIEACAVNTPPCIADALDAYADKLEALAPQLPAQLRNLPTIVREAARKVRAAKTKTEALNAVKSAISQVNKTIALLKAENPNAAATGASVGRAVDQTLQVAEVKLLRSSGL